MIDTASAFNNSAKFTVTKIHVNFKAPILAKSSFLSKCKVSKWSHTKLELEGQIYKGHTINVTFTGVVVPAPSAKNTVKVPPFPDNHQPDDSFEVEIDGE